MPRRKNHTGISIDRLLRQMLKKQSVLRWRPLSEYATLSAFTELWHVRSNVRDDSFVISFYSRRHDFNIVVVEVVDVYPVEVAGTTCGVVHNRA